MFKKHYQKISEIVTDELEARKRRKAFIKKRKQKAAADQEFDRDTAEIISDASAKIQADQKARLALAMYARVGKMEVYDGKPE